MKLDPIEQIQLDREKSLAAVIGGLDGSPREFVGHQLAERAGRVNLAKPQVIVLFFATEEVIESGS